MRRLPPPPPPKKIARGRVEISETQYLKTWDRFIRYMSQRTHHPERLGMSVEDVIGDLTMVLLEAARKHRDESGGWPSPALTKCILRRRVQVLNRNARVPGRTWTAPQPPEGESSAFLTETIPDPAPSVEAAHLRTDRDLTIAEIGRRLQEGLPGGDYSLLVVRFAEGMAPEEIARLTGAPSGRAVTLRIQQAKDRARRLLRRLGVRGVPTPEGM